MINETNGQVISTSNNTSASCSYTYKKYDNAIINQMTIPLVRLNQAASPLVSYADIVYIGII